MFKKIKEMLQMRRKGVSLTGLVPAFIFVAVASWYTVSFPEATLGIVALWAISGILSLVGLLS